MRFLCVYKPLIRCKSLSVTRLLVRSALGQFCCRPGTFNCVLHITPSAFMQASCPSLSFCSIVNCFARLSFPFWAGITHTQGWTRGRRQPFHIELLPSAQLYIHHRFLSTNNLFAFTLMSHSRVAASESSSSNFQLILDNALKVYEKRTKRNLVAHPLASQIQACDSPGDILAVLQQQVQGLDQSRSADERWTKWLDPTINVLFTFSQTVVAVGLVRHALIRDLHSYICFAGILTRNGDLCGNRGSLFGVYP